MSKNKYKITELEEILRMKQMTLKSHLEAKLEAAGYEPKSEDGFLYAKGTFPVLLVAHMDTVHEVSRKSNTLEQSCLLLKGLGEMTGVASTLFCKLLKSIIVLYCLQRMKRKDVSVLRSLL